MTAPWSVAVVLVGIGAVVLGLAALLAGRSPRPAAGARAGALAPVVPWLGSVAAIALAVRGSLPAAVTVAVATLGHAGLARWRALRPRRQG